MVSATAAGAGADRSMIASPSDRRSIGHNGGDLQPYFGAGPVHGSLAAQSDDDELRTAHTVALMTRYAREDSRQPLIRRAALDAIRDLRPRNPRKEAAQVWAWVRRRVRLMEDAELAALAGVGEPTETEVLIRPVDLLSMVDPVGDCDDYSMLTASMLRALGIPSAFRAIAADASQPDTYSHVYVVALIDGRELALDASHGPRPGWEAPAVGKTRTWSIEPMNNGLGFNEPAAPWWQRGLDLGFQTTANILTTRLAQPPPGTFVSGPQGTYYRQQAGGGGSVPFVPFSGGTSLLPWLLIGGLALVVFLKK